MLGTGAAGMTVIDKTFAANAPTLAEMVENYESYKAKKITKGQYDYRRRNLLNQLASKLGPTKALLTSIKNPSEVLRISRSKGTAPTQPIAQQLKRMNSLSKVASKGGVALSVVGLGVACHQIAQTDSQQEKNEILVESLGGLMGGLAWRGSDIYGWPNDDPSRLGGGIGNRSWWGGSRIWDWEGFQKAV